jgi:hypothetical protein
LPKRLRKKSVAVYNWTSGKNGTFLDETPRAEEIMGSDGASLSPLQLMNCLAGIGEVYDVNGMDVISSAAIFNDHCVGREVVAKHGLCAMLAVCIVSGEIKVAAVNVYSRFGSDMTLIVLLVREVLLQSVGKGGKLIVAGQMDYNHRELITVEHTCKAKMKVYLSELQENIDDVTTSVKAT